MSDAFEDRLRAHLAEKAAQVQANPDPGALMERSVGRSGHRRPLTIGALTIAVIFAGSGVLTGMNLVGGRATATPLAAAPSTTVPGRAGASLAPGPSGASNVPSIAVQTPYTFLFTRTTSSGVTIRAYGSGSSATGGCTQGPTCQPVGIVPEPTPCPQTSVCEQPIVIPQAQSGTTGSGSASAGAAGSSGPVAVAPKTRSTPPTGSGGTGPVSVGTVPSQPAAECGQLVVELSTDKAVGTGSVSRPTMTAPSAATVDVLGTGSFGTAEGAPVGWVAVWVGSGVASVHLSSGGTVVDAMTPNSGIAVLATQGNSELTGATVTGVDQSGAAVATTPADQASGPDAANACTTLPTTPPATTPTTDPTTMTTVPPTTTTTVPPTTTTTTTVPPTTTTTAPPATLSTPANTSVTSQNARWTARPALPTA
jgi:hypothetical protein